MSRPLRAMHSAWAIVAFGLMIGRVCVVAVTLYLDVLALAAWRQRRQLRGGRGTVTDRPARRFAVLIPAHDEAGLIADAVTSLLVQDYPNELIDVHVVADNCSDATADVARAAGAIVHERSDPDHPGKGPALQWLRGELAHAAPADAFVFVDADTIVDPDFIPAVDRVLDSGATVVQGHYGVRDAESSAVVAFRAAAMAVRNHLRPLGRVGIGGSAGLYGNGMVFTAEALRDLRWSDHLTEDVELQLGLLHRGTLVAFAPDAKVSAEMPDTLAAAQSQHERWERGRLQLTARWLPSLVRHAVIGGPAPRVAYADAAMDQLVPPLSIVVGATGAWAVAASVRAALPGGRLRRLRLVGTVAGSQAAVVLAALRFVQAPRSVYRSLVGAPRMIVWKIGLWAGVLVQPEQARWKRTARN